MNSSKAGQGAAVLLAVAALAGCSSAASSTARSAAPATSLSPSSAPVTSAASSANDTASSVGSSSAAPTVGALLSSFSAGPITVLHMPTADPSWVARVQTEPTEANGYLKVTDTRLLNLMALVDEAAREGDVQALTRLCSSDCDAAEQLPLWQKPADLATLSEIIERTHMTEGDLLPGFILAGSSGDTDDTADLAVLGASTPSAYIKQSGLATSFSSGSGGLDLPPAHWTGIKIWNPYPAS